jgi:hypothetical protein
MPRPCSIFCLALSSALTGILGSTFFGFKASGTAQDVKKTRQTKEISLKKMLNFIFSLI